MNIHKTSTRIKGLGLCSGGLDSILSALILQRQGILVTWICFETPFFSSESAEKASLQTGIPLIKLDITNEYMNMMKNPKAGFGKNMNPCMDCHTLMFETAGQVLKDQGFHFLFSGEVLGQRPKSQNKNSLRYVEKNSGFDGQILRPLSARRLPETLVEKQGLVDRSQLMDITGRSRKIQLEMAREYGVHEFPAPAGGCLLTDKGFSIRLRDLLDNPANRQADLHTRHLFLLKYGRHFRLDSTTKAIAGRSQQDNQNLRRHIDTNRDLLLRPANIPGPDVVLTGDLCSKNIQTGALICAAYTKCHTGETLEICVVKEDTQDVICVQTMEPAAFKPLMI